MSITKKTALYTALTTIFIGVLIISYFMWMLPGLYAQYKTDRYLETVEEVERRFIEGKTFADGYELSDNFLVTSLRIPKEGHTLLVSTPNVTMDVVIQAEEIKSLFDELRKAFNQFDAEDSTTAIFESIDFQAVKEVLAESYQPISQDLIAFENVETYGMTVIEDTASQDFYQTADDILVFGGSIEQQTNSYANYSAIKEVEGDIYLTFGSSMTPKLTELMPIVAQSIPMILLVLIVVSLVIAQWFSRRLAHPVELLAKQANERKERQGQVFHQPSKGDEFEILQDALNQMHTELNKNLQTLHNQNEQLTTINQRQRLLLANASHQLKTPISGASLLVESMIGRIGKFKDYERYLPEVNSEIRKMHKIVQQLMLILDEPTKEEITRLQIDRFLPNVLENYDRRIQERELTIELEMTSVQIETEENLFVSIVDNVIQNAIKYTPKGQKIFIKLVPESLTVISKNAHVAEEIMLHIKEPFVRDTREEEAGTGLGLYLVDRFVESLNMSWHIKNTNQGVEVKVEWRKNHVDN